MKLLNLILAILLVAFPASEAATVLASYSGGVNPVGSSPPGTLAWATEGNGSTHVITSSAVVDGRAVWEIKDPGVAKDSGANSRYYNVRPTVANIQNMLDFGFDVVLSVKIPGFATDEFGNPVPSNAWPRDSNSSWGLYFADPDTPGNRRSFSMSMGRDSAGQTLVSFGGSTTILVLSPDFHEYKLSYRNGQMVVYVDDVERLTTSGTSATHPNYAVNMLYWGDNSNQLAALGYERMTYFESVQLIQVPEPGKVSILLVGIAAILLRRARSLEVRVS